MPDAKSAHRALVERLESETVALVQPTDEGLHTYCAGVWISPQIILTAAHCVSDLGKPSELDVLEALGLPAPAWNPIGQIALFSLQGELNQDNGSSYWLGKVVAYDKSVDLALVRANAPRPAHAFARLSQSTIAPGDVVEVVGHPGGLLAWSYSEGVVSVVREDLPEDGGVMIPTLQLQVAVSHGNSGGGAFDVDGNLIGIAWGASPEINGMGFFVHRDAIKQFLQAHT